MSKLAAIAVSGFWRLTSQEKFQREERAQLSVIDSFLPATLLRFKGKKFSTIEMCSSENPIVRLVIFWATRAVSPTINPIKLGQRPEVLKLCTIYLVSGIAKNWLWKWGEKEIVLNLFGNILEENKSK